MLHHNRKKNPAQHQRLALGGFVLQRYEERDEILTMVAPLIVKIALGEDFSITVNVYVSEESRYPPGIVLDGLPAVVCRKSIGKLCQRIKYHDVWGKK